MSLYFLDPDRLMNGRPGVPTGQPRNACPIRYAIVEALVAGWTPPETVAE